MFGKRHLMRDGARAEALVLDKMIYASTVQTNTVTACGYQLRVQFDDGSPIEVFRRVMHREGCRADVGDLIPVRYDPSDRSKIEVDIAEVECRDQAAAERTKQNAIARGEAELRGRLTDASAVAPAAVAPADPRIGILEVSLRQAQRRGDASEIERLTAQLAQLQGDLKPGA